MLGLLAHLTAGITNICSRIFNRFRSKEAKAAIKRKVLERTKRFALISNIMGKHKKNTEEAAQHSMSIDAAMGTIKPFGGSNMMPTNTTDLSDNNKKAAEVQRSATRKSNKEEVISEGKGRTKHRHTNRRRNLRRRRGKSRER